MTLKNSALLLMGLAVLAFSACGAEQSSDADLTTGDLVGTESSSEEELVVDGEDFFETENQEGVVKEEAIEFTGSYAYYLSEDEHSVYKSVKDRICLKPAQMETVGGGHPICLTNDKAELLKMLNFDEIEVDLTCSRYSGVGTFFIKNLVQAPDSSGCAKLGKCDFNEAELVEVKEFFNNERLPVCSD